MRSAASAGKSTKLAAWVTGWIEVEADAALAFLEENYLGNAQRKAEEIKAVLAALSVHGTRGHVHLRERIVAGYRNVLISHPGLVMSMVSDFRNWQRWEATEEVKAILEAPPAELDRASLLELRAYLRQAQEERTTESSDNVTGGEKGSSFLFVVLGVLVVLPIFLLVARKGARVAGRKD